MRVRRFSLAALVALMMLAGLTARVQAAESVTLIATPAEVTAGTTVNFVGSGFQPRERVSFWATTPNQIVLGGEYAAANRDGEVRFGFEIPSDAIGGRWAMTAYGEYTKTPAIATFMVIGVPPEQSRFFAAVAPESGPPGTTFAFAATGFDEKERVSYWFTGPDGVVYDAYSQQVRTNTEGRIDITWTSPVTAVKGRWVITIQGIRSDVSRGITFEIR